MTYSRVSLDRPLCEGPPPRPRWPMEDGTPWWRHRRGPTPEDYLSATVPHRVLTASLASGTPTGALTALRMLGAVDHPLWGVLTGTGEDRL